MVDSNEKVYLCTQNQFMTMKQTRTAREMLAQIENDFFKGVNLAAASRYSHVKCGKKWIL